MASGTMSGSGTLLDPYIVEDATDLKAIETYGMSAHYQQANDITLGTFEPIGYGSGTGHTNFTGSYDGQGYKIQNGTISYTSDTYIGLFAWIQPASSSYHIQNIHFYNVTVAGLANTGVLTGEIYRCYYIHDITIENCTVTGSSNYTGTLCGQYYNNTSTQPHIYNNYVINSDISGTSYVGGLFGYTNYIMLGTVSNECIMNCYVDSDSTVYGSGSYIGGILGREAYYAGMSRVWNGATVTSSGAGVGGIIGYTNSVYDVINCYNTGVITGNTSIGGIAGGCVTVNSLKNSYNSGNIVAVGYAGGLVGNATTVTLIEACFALNSDIERTSGTYLQFGRLVGAASTVTAITNCYARDDMTFTYV